MPTISFKNQTVTVIKPLTTTQRNDQVLVWEDAPETNVSGCRFQPEIGNEQTSNSYGVGRDSVASRGVVFGPTGMDVAAIDRVRFNGDVYEIDGPIRRWSSPSGRLAHVEFTVERVEG